MDPSTIFKTMVRFVETKQKDSLVKFLQNHENIVDVSSPEGNRTLLMLCAAKGRLEYCRVLLDLGANINAVDKELLTPLILASRCGQDHLIKYLVDRGADVDHQDNTGMTALKWSIYASYPKVTAVLCEVIEARLNQDKD